MQTVPPLLRLWLLGCRESSAHCLLVRAHLSQARGDPHLHHKQTGWDQVASVHFTEGDGGARGGPSWRDLGRSGDCPQGHSCLSDQSCPSTSDDWATPGEAGSRSLPRGRDHRHWWPLSPMLQGLPCLSGDWTLWSFSFCPALCFCKFLLCQLVHFTDGDGDTQVAGSLSVRSLP